jgi:O-antigen ligase
VENNVHNVYLQFLLEGGVQSLAAYLAMIAAILAKKVATPMQRNVKAFLLCYLVLSFIQFNGYEAYLWFFIGMFLAFPRQLTARALRLPWRAAPALPHPAQEASP